MFPSSRWEPPAGGFVGDPSTPSRPAVRGSRGEESLSSSAKDDTPTLRRLRRTIIETAYRAKEGHIPSALSILDIVWVLYDQVMAGRLIHPGDRFVLSKGHGCLALYAVLAEKGYFPAEHLASFCAPGSDLEGHPNRRVPGVEAATGSLGHGLPMAVGMAYGLRLRQSLARVFCLVGDQELNEGSCWEAIMLAGRFKLANLTMIVDDNRSSERSNPMGDIGAKIQPWGWSIFQCDGHDHAAIRTALQPAPFDSPQCVVARTVKGYGCDPMIDDPSWHHRVPSNQAELERLLAFA